jgi:hypothetical protein
MKKSAASISFLLLFSAAACTATPVAAQRSDEIIAKARACLGDDAALSAVHSLHFLGVLETQKETPAGLVPQKASIEIVFQKPCQQCIVVTGAESIETTGLDEYAAWQREQSQADPARWNISVLGPEMIEWLRATTWENLFFFKGIEQQGGTAVVVGRATIDGHAAVKVAFAHGAGIVFYRYFDPATGKLLLSETKDRTIKEEGEIVVNGLRFPQKEVQTIKALDANGKPVERKIIVTFDKITLNEAFPESHFEMPMLPSTQPSSVVNVPGSQPAAAPAAEPAAVK